MMSSPMRNSPWKNKKGTASGKGGQDKRGDMGDTNDWVWERHKGVLYSMGYLANTL